MREGKITDNKGVPTMNLENERAITFYGLKYLVKTIET